MIWTKLKAHFWKRRDDWAGSQLNASPALNECYAEIDQQQRRQGDVYPATAFTRAMPNDKVPFWMLINRNCHLYQDATRPLKIAYLNYIAVYPLRQYVTVNSSTEKTLKNLVIATIKNNESCIFLPELSGKNDDEPLVALFNLIHTIPATDAPRAALKTLQLSSPFCEHAFQKLARYFYTVGYDDRRIHSKAYIDDLVGKLGANHS